MTKLLCVFCRKGPQDGVNLYRIYEKGQPGVWACSAHLNQTDAPPVDPAVSAIVKVLKERSND